MDCKEFTKPASIHNSGFPRWTDILSIDCSKCRGEGSMVLMPGEVVKDAREQ